MGVKNVLENFSDLFEQDFTKAFMYEYTNYDDEPMPFHVENYFNFLYEKGFKMISCNTRNDVNMVFEKNNVKVIFSIFSGFDEYADSLWIECEINNVF